MLVMRNNLLVFMLVMRDLLILWHSCISGIKIDIHTNILCMYNSITLY